MHKIKISRHTQVQGSTKEKRIRVICSVVQVERQKIEKFDDVCYSHDYKDGASRLHVERQKSSGTNVTYSSSQ